MRYVILYRNDSKTGWGKLTFETYQDAAHWTMNHCIDREYEIYDPNGNLILTNF